jgi:hypothetical protein
LLLPSPPHVVQTPVDMHTRDHMHKCTGATARWPIVGVGSVDHKVQRTNKSVVAHCCNADLATQCAGVIACGQGNDIHVAMFDCAGTAVNLCLVERLVRLKWRV